MIRAPSQAWRDTNSRGRELGTSPVRTGYEHTGEMSNDGGRRSSTDLYFVW